MSKKRRKRRRKVHPGTGGGRGEESGEDFSEDEDVFMIDMSSDEEEENDGSRCVEVNAGSCTTSSAKKGFIYNKLVLQGTGRFVFCLRTAASQKLKQCLGHLFKSDLANRRKLSSDCASLAEKQICLLDTGQESVLFPQCLLGPPLCPSWKLFLESSPHAWLEKIPGTFRAMRQCASPSLLHAKSSAFSM